MHRGIVRHAGHFATIFAISALATACTNSPSPTAPTIPAPVAPVVTVASVQVTSSASSGTSFQLTAIARSSDGSSQDVTQSATWLSSDVSLATITSTGGVTVIGTGNVDLTATFQGITGLVRVSVSRPEVFTLRGVVRDSAPDGQPIEGARVQSLSGLYDHTFSDSFGNYMLAGLSAGQTIIEVTKSGYQTWSSNVAIVESGSLDVALDADQSVSGGAPERRDVR